MKVRIAHPQADRGLDLYETPPNVTEALLRAESISGRIWEPAAGRGAIARVLRTAGHDVVTSDIVERDYPLDFVGDFLEQRSAPPGVETIIANPPYNRRVLNRFVAHALDLAPSVAMMVRLSFLESANRTDILEDRGLARVHVFRERVRGMHRDGWSGKKAGQTVGHCWCVWSRGHTGSPVINRISINHTGNGRAGAKSLTSKRKAIMSKVKPELVSETTSGAALEATMPPVVTDPFDLSNLRISPNFTETAGVRKLLKTVPIKKPNRQEYFRVHANPAFRGDFAQIELKEDRESYLVAGADLIAALVDEITFVTLYTCVNRQNVVFLWPVPLPQPDGRVNVWHLSAHEGAREATTQWVKLSSNMGLGAYDISVAEGIRTEPNWPDVDFGGLIRIAYRDRLITSLDHPVVKRLNGLA